MKTFRFLLSMAILIPLCSGLMASAQVDVDITAFSHPDIPEVKRGGGWVLNAWGGGDPTGPVYRLAAFTWSPIGDQAKIIYFSEVFDGDYFETGQMSAIFVQFDLGEIQGYKINDARLVLRDNWSGSDNEFAFEISRIPSGPDWEPFPDPRPDFGHEWADGRNSFVTPNGFRIDSGEYDYWAGDAPQDIQDAAQEILDSQEWPEEIIQGSCWAFRNENGDPWDPLTPEGEIGMIHEMPTWDQPEGTILSVGGTESISTSLADLVQGWVSGRYQNHGIVIHPSYSLTPLDLNPDAFNDWNVHGGWHNYNNDTILLAVDAEQVDPPISEPFRDDAQTGISEWSLF